MRSLIPTLVLVGALGLSALALPDPALARETYQAEATEFLEALKKGEGADAVETLLGRNEWIPPGAINNLRTVLANHPNMVGECMGYELLDTLTVGDSMVVMTYLVRYARQPLTVEFTFYKADKTWVILGLNVRSEFLEEVKAEARERVIDRLPSEAGP